jgi:cytochrome b involved in lipid metabolism
MWVRYNGKVYDVSKYMEDHPGGKEPYFDHLGGKDATDAFDEADHTKAAIRLSETYCIGEF